MVGILVSREHNFFTLIASDHLKETFLSMIGHLSDVQGLSTLVRTWLEYIFTLLLNMDLKVC